MGWHKLLKTDFEAGRIEMTPVSKDEVIADIKQSFRPPYQDIWLRYMERFNGDHIETATAHYWLLSED